jgi:cobalt-zinc-cadmium efflux system membrane fusion protein
LEAPAQVRECETESVMKLKSFNVYLVVSILALLVLNGCRSVQADPDLKAEAPPAANVIAEGESGAFKVDHPDQFPVIVAAPHAATQELVATGSVSPDVSRNVPVISLASGRVVAIHARLGDTVQKGQLLLSVRSSDVASGFSDYRKAVSDETLARTQLERAQDLYSHGAVSMNDLQVAQNAEAKAKVDVETMAERLRLLGNDPEKPNSFVDIFAPVSGVITDQQVTDSAGVQALSGPNPFTISDLSHVWIVCDVYENDLSLVRVGESADIRLNAYPTQVFKGSVSNIGASLDPALRTAKVRIQVENPGIMRFGMFVSVTFHGQTTDMHAAVPASAVLHLRDRDWVYVQAGNGQFTRLEVKGGAMLPGNMQEITAGLKPGQTVVSNALVLQNTVEQ